MAVTLSGTTPYVTMAFAATPPWVRLGDRFPRRPQSCAAEVDLTDGGDA
jgi:hypothetical protein